MYTHTPSSSSSSTRTPPFSVAEFRALVSAALDSDAPALALSLRTSSSSLNSSLHRKKSSQNLNLAMTMGFSSSSSAVSHHVYACASVSRVRVLLSKLKKRAAALRGLVRRRRSSASTSAPSSRTAAPMGVTVTTENLSVDSGSDTGALFTPYLPLAAQYERGTTLPFVCAPASSTSCSAPSPCSSECSHTPPSSTASSFSARSSLSHYLCASRPHSLSPVYNDADPDPFAKGAVRVVYRSCEVLPVAHGSYGGGRMGGVRPSLRRTGRGRRVGRSSSSIVRSSSSGGHAGEEDSKAIDDSGVCLDVEDVSSSSHSTETETEPFAPPRTSTPPPRPSNPTPSSLPPSSSLPLSSGFPPAANAATKLSRAPTARTFPLSSPRLHGAANGKGRKGRPSSPFPLSLGLGLGRAATTRN
ncbi:hypothetical protein C8R45DRAFT_942183 [Mycena sanguinolenta]|nr:hypothetical protein C8R45DRAFT_942183 [Mycena sanguinolenta]